jgi:hypothetical protein
MLFNGTTDKIANRVRHEKLPDIKTFILAENVFIRGKMKKKLNRN